MSERELSPESQEMLPKAVNEVTKLYIGDKFISSMPIPYYDDHREQSWNKTAQEFPMFGEQIKGIREMMKHVEFKKLYFQREIDSLTLGPFNKIEDELAQKFLADVMFSRMTKTDGYIDRDLDPTVQFEGMANEIGLTEGNDWWEKLRSQQVKDLTLKQIVGKVLTGDLRVTHQLKPE